MPPRPVQIAVVGSARLKDKATISACRALGRTLAEAGFSIVCGGLGGVMSEVCRGFKEPTMTRGVTIGILPGYDFTSANPFIDVIIPTGLDVGRNQLVIASGQAVIAVGGGAGTLSEIALASQLNKPIILLRGSGGWADRLDGDYLDERCNTRLHRCEENDDVARLLKDLLEAAPLSGPINSGHQQRSQR